MADNATTASTSGESPSRNDATGRLVSLDAFRGGVMLLMASSGFGLAQLAKAWPEHRLLQFLAHQCEHAEWAGCTLWDLIQPAFMFSVGVALPWSMASRRRSGQSFAILLAHALKRAALLTLLAVFLTSAWSPRTEWVFTNVLAQIGLGYPFMFLVAFTRPRTQALIALGILVGYWLAFALYAIPPNVDWAAVGVPERWSHLNGFAAHWEKNANLASHFDIWFLNQFPRTEPFVFSSGGYQTLNFVPSIATMIFGLIAGERMRSNVTMRQKLRSLVLAGLVGILLGAALNATGICPIVKRLWTPSWTLFSTGWVLVLFATTVALFEAPRPKAWAFPLVVVGLNPITLYCLWQLSGSFILSSFRIHLGQGVFSYFGTPSTAMFERMAVLLTLWLIVFWMYRRRIFLRL